MKSPQLLPAPQSLKLSQGAFTLPQDLYLLLPNNAPDTIFAAERFALEAEPLTGCAMHLATGPSVSPAAEIRLSLDPDAAPGAPENVKPQSYKLTITPEGIDIAAPAVPGLFYALQTLLQLLRQAAFEQLARKTQDAKRKTQKPLQIPALVIVDFPNFPRRGVYHDTARGKVPTLDTLLHLVDDLAHLKYNEFQLYVENNYQFRKHPDMYDDTTPFTAEELLTLDAACRARHIDFVPSLTSLGHFEKILNRLRYRALAEAEPAQLKAINATCWYEAAPWSLCTTDPAAKQFLKDMYDEFVPNFSSPHFNICCDESYDIGVIRSKEYADKIGGPGKLYVEWINYCNDLARSHGKTIQMWGDIILKYPDLIASLPEHAVLLEWGYEHDHKFDEHCATFAERLGSSENRTFYVSPGTSTWLTLTCRTKNACGNIHNAATAGLKHGATGLLVTDWGDNGHQQMLSLSLLPFAYGAAASWNLQAAPNPYASDVRTLTSAFLKPASLHLFHDPAQAIAVPIYDLGLTYERLGWQRFNASVDWYLFREKFDFANYVNRVQPKHLEQVIASLEKLRKTFASAALLHPDADQLLAELAFTCDEVIHACQRTLVRKQWLAADPARRNPEEPTQKDKKPVPLPKNYKQQLKSLAKNARSLRSQFESLWRARNKESRLADITTEFDRLISEYGRFTK